MMARRSSGRAFKTVSSWPWPMIMCCWRPTPESLSSSWMSSSRHGAPLMAYSLSPERKSVRVMVTSDSSIGSLPDELSMVSDTSARPSWGRDEVPAKMTSSIFAERNERGPWAPSTQVTASTTLDLPLPLGPTTTVIPGSNSSTVGSAKDLKPFMLSDFRNIGATLPEAYGWRKTHTWQCSQKKVERPPAFTRTMVLRQRRQGCPSRS